MSQFPRPRMQQIGEPADACTCAKHAWSRTCPQHGTPFATPGSPPAGARRCPSTPSAGSGILAGVFRVFNVESVLPLLIIAIVSANLAGAIRVGLTLALIAIGWTLRNYADTVIRYREAKRAQARIEAWIKASADASQRPPYVD